MGYEIWYDRAFVKTEAGVMPIVQVGSNNCFTWDNLPAKEWTLFTGYENGSSVAFYKSKEDYRNAMERLIASDERFFISRHHAWDGDRFLRWIVNGFNTAKTLEEWLELGNNFGIEIERIDSRPFQKWNSHPRTSSDLVDFVLCTADTKNGGRYIVRPRFLARNIRKSWEKKRRRRNAGSLIPKNTKVYYSLKKSGYGYLVKVLPSGYRYSDWISSARKFKTFYQATKYLEKYKYRLKGFEVVEEVLSDEEYQRVNEVNDHAA